MALEYLVPRDVLTLAELTRAEWPAVRELIRASGHPTCEGDDEAAEKTAAAEDAEDAAAAAQADDDGDEKIGKDDDWETKARKHERDRKKAVETARRTAKERDDLAARLKKREEADLSEQEKAIAKAREEATSEVTTKYEATIRADRIEGAVTRLALKGLKGKDVDDKDVTLKFADPDDAQLRLDRAIRNGDIAYDDLYADGKVNTAAVTDFLTELLEEHPRLRAEDSNGKPREVVDMDGGKGKGSGSGKSLEEMSPDDHLKAIQGTR